MIQNLFLVLISYEIKRGKENEETIRAMSMPI
jgi:hypothetical protein